MKTSRIALTLILFAAAVAAVVISKQSRQSPNVAAPPPGASFTVAPTNSSQLPQTAPELEPLPALQAVPAGELVTESAAPKPSLATNKLERLGQIRETFRTLAAGDKLNAMRAAKQITDAVERETALLTLVTEWTQGELSSPQMRARRIAQLGLEAGLGIELAKNPALALMWADELTDGAGRTAMVHHAARFLLDSDPAAAFALSQRLADTDRREFSDELFADWASRDTDAALKWADQFSDAADRDAAMQAIRTSAPVGIGAVLSADAGGYPFIANLVPGMPAERSGQLRVGDQIVAIAQAGGPFMDLNEVSLKNVIDAIRGAPNTMLQLKVVPSGAAPNTPPKTVVIVRDQIKFKK